jgi:hypothetical protein
MGNTDGVASSAQNYAYYFTYTRTVNGVPVAIDKKSGTSSGDDFPLPWAYERITIIIDNNGIQLIEWISQTQTGEIITEDTGLISFSDAISVFEKMILAEYEPKAQLGTDGVLEDIRVTVSIDNIQLSLVRVREQNSKGKVGLYIPAWVFYGHVADERTYSASSGLNGTYVTYDGGSNYPLPKYAALIINAVDGSIINTSLGY